MKDRNGDIAEAASSGRFDYNAYVRRKYVYIAVGLVICAVAFFADVLYGSTYIDPGDILGAMFHPNQCSDTMHIIVWDIKMPAAFMALVVGASLGIAGAVMQTMLNNPLASPYTLGVSGGASFGAALMMVVGAGATATLSIYLVPIGAFVFALVAAGGIYMVARVKGFSSNVMVLAGIGLVFLFQALLALMQYMASQDVLENIVFWTYGSLTGSEWNELAMVLIVFLVFFLLIMRNSWKLTAMKLGDNRAASLGVDTNKVRKRMFIVITLLTATCVAFVGAIGFIGIVGPHVARMLLGEDQRFYIPMSAVCGAGVLIVASCVSKMIVPGVVFPIGILTAIVGVPFFFYILLRRRKAIA